MVSTPAAEPGPPALQLTGSFWDASGWVSLAAAQSDVDVIAAQLEKAYPDTNAHKTLLLTSLLGAFTEPYRSGFDLLCVGTAAIC